MATDIRGLFENNRRRTVDAVTTTFPAVLQEGSLRDGTAATVVESGTYTALTLPKGVIVTGVKLVVDEAFDSATSATLAVKLGTTAVVAATTVKTAALTATNSNMPMLLTADTDVIGTFAITGATTKGIAKVVIEFIDYNGATTSYIGRA